jgi:hypothetical protein
MITVTVTDDEGNVLDIIKFDDANVVDGKIVHAGIMRDVARPQLWYRVAAAAEWVASTRILMAAMTNWKANSTQLPMMRGQRCSRSGRFLHQGALIAQKVTDRERQQQTGRSPMPSLIRRHRGVRSPCQPRR